MTICDWLRTNQKELPEGESTLLLSFVLKKEKAFILAHPEYILSREEEALLEQCATKRKKHEPIAYLTGEKEFFGRPFFVTKATLIPRPETELLVEHILNHIDHQISLSDRQAGEIKKERMISLLDIGTGSACIPVSILATLREKNPQAFSAIRCIATDISSAALHTASDNATRHELSDAIDFIHSDLLSEIPSSFFEADEIILSANLPYLSKDIYEASPDDVRLHEPKSALLGDAFDGTSLMKTLLMQCRDRVSPSTSRYIILEISPEQSHSLLRYTQGLFPEKDTSILQDLSGRDRFLIIQNEKKNIRHQ